MRNKKKKLYFFLILIVLFGISIGYAAISRALTITGNSEIKQNTWDLHLENVQVINGSVTANTPVIDTTTKSTVNFNVMLNLPGDYYMFTVDVVNDGSIDAMVDSVVKTPELTEAQKKYLNYVIEYQNGESINKKQLVSAGSFLRIKVKVEYIKDITESDLLTTSEVLNLGFTVNYIQGDSTGVNVNNSGFSAYTSGSLDDVGTIVTIGTEKFYVIGTEGDNVKLLSMMNVTLEENPIQSEGASETVFSNDEQHGTNYSDYNGSIVEKYVNNYKRVLEKNFGMVIAEARLITRSELQDQNTFNCNNSCSGPYSWITSVDYWTGTSYSSTNVWDVFSGGCFSYPYNIVNGGVRPVIVIAKDDIILDKNQ